LGIYFIIYREDCEEMYLSSKGAITLGKIETKSYFSIFLSYSLRCGHSLAIGGVKLKRKYLIGIGGNITLATIVSFNVFGNPVSSNEEKVTDEEITIHNNNYYQDGYDDYDIEILSNGGMALATFLSEKLKDTDLRLNLTYLICQIDLFILRI
jgi:hypothetical protein